MQSDLVRYYLDQGYPPLLSVAQGSEILGFSRFKGYQLVREGRWPTALQEGLGGAIQMKLSDLIDFIIEGGALAPGEPGRRRRGRPTKRQAGGDKK